MKELSPDKLLGIVVGLVFVGLVIAVFIGLMDEKQDNSNYDIHLEYTPPHE